MTKKAQILVVDDNPTEQRLMSLLLDRFGFRCLIAASGEQALALLADNNDVDVILMDWQMRGMNGLECTERIREMQQRNGQYIPIIAVTARVMLGDKQKCLSAGMDDYLSKPFTQVQLKEILEFWINARKSSMIS